MNLAQDYVIELVKTYAFIEAAYFEKYQLTSFYLAKIDERISPVILEWFQMPFLPFAKMMILYDCFMGYHGTPTNNKMSGQKWEKYFNHELKDQEHTTLQFHIADTVKTAYGIKEGQKIRARGLALVNPESIGGFTGSIPDVYKAIQNMCKKPATMPDYFFLETTPMDDLLAIEEKFLRLWNLHDIILHLKTWNSFEIGKFLKKPLRPQNLEKQKAEVAISHKMAEIPKEENQKLSGLDSFIRLLKNQPSGEIWQAILQRVLSAIQEEAPATMNQEVPAGGYADISNRGHFDQILPSNLVYPEEEFLRRFIEGELLFYEREAPPAPTPPEQWIFLDHSPINWGIPRVAASALAISLINKSLETGAQIHALAAGRLERPFENLDTISGVQELLNYRRWFSEIKTELRHFFYVLKNAISKNLHDVYICSELENKSTILEQIAKTKLPFCCRIYVFLVDAITAKAFLYKHQQGALIECFSVSLALKDLTIAKNAPIADSNSIRYSMHPQMLWDFSSDPLCADIDNRGIAVTGHQNGEIHLWDVIHGNHLGQVARFHKAVLEIAIFENHIIVITKENVFHFDLNKGITVDLKYPRESRGCIRHGWVPGEFFWFTTADTLILYNATTMKTTKYDHSHKTSYLPFFVCNQKQEILWKNAGKEIVFDLYAKKEGYAPEYAGCSFLDNYYRTSIVDCNNTIVAYTSGSGAPHTKLNWLTNEQHEITMEIKNSQWAKAIHVQHQRLMAINSNSLWFLSLKKGSLIKKCSGMMHKIRRISWIMSKTGCAHGIKIDICTTPVILYWKENEVGFFQCNNWNSQSGFVNNNKLEYDILVADEKETQEKEKRLDHLYSHSSLHQGWITHSLLVGKWLVICCNQRKLEFYFLGNQEPSIFFWFKSRHYWAITNTEGQAAGTEKGNIHLPQGVTFRPNGEVALGRILSKGSGLI